MIYPFLIAGLILLVAFAVHTVGGTKLYSLFKPNEDSNDLKYWTLGAACFQMVSVDLFLTGAFALLLGLETIPYDHYVALFITLLYGGYLAVWLTTLAVLRVRKSFFMILGQWMIFLVSLLLLAYGMMTQ